MKKALCIIYFFLFTISISNAQIKMINSPDAPAAIGPYSHAIEASNFIFCSGQIPIDPITNQIVENDIEKQTRQIFKNIKAVLKEAGSSVKNVVKCTVFMTDLNNFAAMNKIYSEEFDGHKPARSTVQVARLPKDVMIEIECIAVKGQ